MSNGASSASDPGAAAGRPYHHGDLRRALAETATELARAGGPDAIVLREVARRVGVSATAAYRHFASHDELIAAVKQQALAEMADLMQAELDRVRRTRDPAVLARRRLAALGHGYLRFAWSQPQLFRTAFAAGRSPGDRGEAGPAAGSASPARPDGWRPSGAAPGHPHLLLASVLDELAAAGTLTAPRDGLDYVVWAAVHGLAILGTEGSLRTASDADREQLASSTIDMILRGI